MTANDIYKIAGHRDGRILRRRRPRQIGEAESVPQVSGIDGSFNLYIADAANNRVREVSASTFSISDIPRATAGRWPSVGDSGSALGGGLYAPTGLASDSRGDIFIADTFNNRVQEIAASAHSQFGIAMTAGAVYTVAGSATGESGISGDGGNATASLLNEPGGVAVDASGNLYIVDGGNNRIQEVSASTGNISTFAGSATGATGDSGQGGSATSALLNTPQGGCRRRQRRRLHRRQRKYPKSTRCPLPPETA